MLIRSAEVDGTAPLDVRLDRGRVAEIARDLDPVPREPVLDAEGGALLPGLHDHHLHLFALAAFEASVRCGPPTVRDLDGLRRALRETPPSGEWVRGVGYHESVAGDLDRDALDPLVSDRPARVQHRSGAMWILNSQAVDRLGLDRGMDRAGVERDARGRATGRLFRLDDWLRDRLDAHDLPCLARVSQRLASYGVTGVTDATAHNSEKELCALLEAVQRRELGQRVLVMGAPGLPEPEHSRVSRGAVKILLDERALPQPEDLERRVRDAHLEGRAVAIHCVTRCELVMAAVALEAAGAAAGDRIEHAAVAPPDVVALLSRLAVTVVTQPGFVRERGDAYRAGVDPGDRPWLYRCRGFLDASVPLAAGTDAPFGDPDPWRAIRSAVDRRTEEGAALGRDEALRPEEALALFTSPPESPGSAPRRIRVGAPADLCLLDRPWSDVRRELSSACVAATILDGSVLWRAG